MQLWFSLRVMEIYSPEKALKNVEESKVWFRLLDFRTYNSFSFKGDCALHLNDNDDDCSD